MTGIRELVKLELLYFFRNNPSVLDSVGGISKKLGREEAYVEPLIREFVRDKILNEIDIEGLLVYEYDPKKDRELQKKRIEKLDKDKVVEKAEGL
jgi:hypothetical protein